MLDLSNLILANNIAGGLKATSRDLIIGGLKATSRVRITGDLKVTSLQIRGGIVGA